MAERDVVVLVGVPLVKKSLSAFLRTQLGRYASTTYGTSEGVSGLGSGGGRFIKVGCEACAIAVSDMLAILL